MKIVYLFYPFTFKFVKLKSVFFNKYHSFRKLLQNCDAGEEFFYNDLLAVVLLDDTLICWFLTLT